MGYTHYFYRESELDAKRFKAVASDCKAIIEFAKGQGIKIGNGMGDPETDFTADADKILFNGVAEEAHETFEIPQTLNKEPAAGEDGKIFDFCKTACKPYDTVVTACLVAFKHGFGDDFDVHSDGEEGDFNEGKELYKAACGVDTEKITVLEAEEE